jgi:hypothetical protein
MPVHAAAAPAAASAAAVPTTTSSSSPSSCSATPAQQHQFPLCFPRCTERLRLVADNPVACALTFKLQMQAVMKELIGVPPQHLIRQSAKETLEGVFGESRACILLPEFNNRKFPHAHGLLFSDVHPHLLQRWVDDPAAMRAMCDRVDSEVLARLDMTMQPRPNDERMWNSRQPLRTVDDCSQQRPTAPRPAPVVHPAVAVSAAEPTVPTEPPSSPALASASASADLSAVGSGGTTALGSATAGDTSITAAGTQIATAAADSTTSSIPARTSTSDADATAAASAIPDAIDGDDPRNSTTNRLFLLGLLPLPTLSDPASRREFDYRVEVIARSVGTHTHAQTCHSGAVGKTRCRMGLPAGLRALQTGPLQLQSLRNQQDGTWEPKGQRVMDPRPEQSNDPLLAYSSDSRVIVVEIYRPPDDQQRPHPMPWSDQQLAEAAIDALLRSNAQVARISLDVELCPRVTAAASADSSSAAAAGSGTSAAATSSSTVPPVVGAVTYAEESGPYLRDDLPGGLNGSVVCFNPVSTVTLVCNTAIYFLGNANQAKSIIYYVTDYIVKDSEKLENVLPALRSAFLHLQQYGSTADDAGTLARNTIFVLTRLINQLKGAQETPLTMCALALLGCPSTLCGDTFWWCYIWPAVQYCRSNTMPAISRETQQEAQEAFERSTNHELPGDCYADLDMDEPRPPSEEDFNAGSVVYGRRGAAAAAAAEEPAGAADAEAVAAQPSRRMAVSATDLGTALSLVDVFPVYAG